MLVILCMSPHTNQHHSYLLTDQIQLHLYKENQSRQLDSPYQHCLFLYHSILYILFFLPRSDFSLLLAWNYIAYRRFEQKLNCFLYSKFGLRNEEIFLWNFNFTLTLYWKCCFPVEMSPARIDIQCMSVFEQYREAEICKIAIAVIIINLNFRSNANLKVTNLRIA